MSQDPSRHTEKIRETTGKEARSLGRFLSGVFSDSGTTLLLLLVLVMFLSTILSSVPMDTLGLKEEEVQDSKQKLADAVRDAYETARNDLRIRKAIVETLKEEPYLCPGAPESSFEFYLEEGNSYLIYDTLETNADGNIEGARIRITFTPDLERMTNNISAYINAVNGAVGLYAKEKDTSVFEPPVFTIPVPEDAVIDHDAGEDYGSLTEEGRELYESTGGEDPSEYRPYTDAESDEFAEEVSSHKTSFFFADPKPSRWDGLPEGELPQTDEGETEVGDVEGLRELLFLPEGDLRREHRHHRTLVQEEGCLVMNALTEEIQDDIHACDGSDVELEANEVLVHQAAQWKEFDSDILTGEIRINMYYSLYSYKLDEIHQTIEYLIGTETDITENDAHDAVWDAIKEFYGNYAVSYNSDCSEEYHAMTKEELEEAMENCYAYADNREEIFERVIRDEGWSAIHEWGYTVILVNGEPMIIGVDGEDGRSGMLDPSWITVEDIQRMYAMGLIHMTTLGAETHGWCTAFARAWFYLHYGSEPWYTELHGSGYAMALCLLQEHSRQFQLYREPVPGAIVSVQCKGNHVLCIDGYDKERGIITFSDGSSHFGDENTPGIHNHFSMDTKSFYKRYGSDVVIVGPME